MQGRHGLAARARSLDHRRARGREGALHRAVDHARPVLASERRYRIHAATAPFSGRYADDCRTAGRMIAGPLTGWLQDLWSDDRSRRRSKVSVSLCCLMCWRPGRWYRSLVGLGSVRSSSVWRTRTGPGRCRCAPANTPITRHPCPQSWERDRLRDERRSLLHAHHAGAMPLDLLNEEQDRIARRLAFLDSRIDAGQVEYDQAEPGYVRGRMSNPTTSRVRTSNLGWARPVSRSRTWVDSIERYGNRRQGVEQLVSAWSQGSGHTVEPADRADDPLIDMSAEPRRRARTRLTNKEVDAMRTARAQGSSVNALARRFGVHRGTVWAKTRPLVARI